MLTALIIGAVIGFVLAIPPGPIAMASLRLGLEKGRRATFIMSLGTASLDMLYCMMAVFAASTFQAACSEFFDKYPIILLIFQISIICLLLIYGIKQFKQRNSPQQDIIIENKTPRYLNDLKYRGPFLLGVALLLTNIANPTFLPSLTIMSAWVSKIGLFYPGTYENLIFSLGFGAGNFLWLYLLGIIVCKNKHRFSDAYLMKIRQFAGLTFIGFGGLIGYRVLIFTNWANIFKFVFAI